jgi:hypothetical protein
MFFPQLSRNVYHVILLVLIGSISLYSFLRLFTFSSEFPKIETEHFQLAVIFFIILYETGKANKIMILIITIVFLPALIGILFTVMHWPYGRITMLISISIILGCLFVNATKYSQDKIITVIILLYPAIHFIAISASLFHLPVSAPLWVLNVVIMLLVSISLGINLGRKMRKV